MEIIELDGVQLKFSKLTTGDEDAFKEWLRQSLIQDAKRNADDLELVGKDRTDYLVSFTSSIAGRCNLVSPFGLEHATQTVPGICKILSLASRRHHPEPGIDDTTLRRLILERSDDLLRVLQNVMPVKIEKKATGGSKVIQPGTP